MSDTDFDLVVLGGGTGNTVAERAADAGLDTALVEEGPLGGTCLNRGCNPSKKLIHRADAVREVRAAADLDVEARVSDAAFREVVRTVREEVTAKAERMERQFREDERLTLYHERGRFVGERTVAVGDERITGERVVVAGGTRPAVPGSIDGTDAVEFLTSDDALALEDRPNRLVVVGGGYIAAELAHFFGTLGTEVVIVGHAPTLLPEEDDDVRRTFTEAYERRFEVHTGYAVTALSQGDRGADVHVDEGDDEYEYAVAAESDDGDSLTVAGDELLLATGRRPNDDTWDLAAGNVETDDRGYVETDATLETSVENVWAIGDIIGEHPFKHAGDREGETVVRNAVHGESEDVDYTGMAHAVFGSPQVASVGAPERDLDEPYRVGTASYDHHPLGETLETDGGFAKALATPDGEILGCHVVGPDAASLLHEVVVAVTAGGGVDAITDAIHVHPSLPQIVEGAFDDL